MPRRCRVPLRAPSAATRYRAQTRVVAQLGLEPQVGEIAGRGVVAQDRLQDVLGEGDTFARAHLDGGEPAHRELAHGPGGEAGPPLHAGVNRQRGRAQVILDSSDPQDLHGSRVDAPRPGQR